jgi:HAD superfamily hydrolase (TIGR01509 family)
MPGGKRMIRAIIFDLGDVLVTGLTGIGSRLEPSLHYPAGEILRQFRGDEMQALLLGTCSEEQYLDRLKRAYGWPLSTDEIKAVIREHFKTAMPGARELVLDLARDYPLYLLSDHGREWIEFIESQHDFLSVFRRRFYSFDLHARKNDPETYRRVLSTIGVAAAECLFIDDRRAFLGAAAQAGLQTLQFEDAVQTRNTLANLAIRVAG